MTNEEGSPRFTLRILVPLVILGIVAAFGAIGLWFGGGPFFQYLGAPISLPRWSLALLTVGPATIVACGIVILWKIWHKQSEKQRRPIIVKGVRWRWWTHRNGSLRVVPYCEACDLQLRPREVPPDAADNSSGFVLHCNSCGQETERFRGALEDAPELILGHFMQNLRKESELALSTHR